ncbi:MAG: DUF2339 domain-containing protein [Candidatus Acidiferrales bacterium]
MHGGGELLIGVILLLLVIGPILGIAAWVRVSRLRRESLPSSEIPGLLGRIYALEQRLARIEKQLANLGQRPAQAGAPPQPEPRVTPREVTPRPAPPVPPASAAKPPSTSPFAQPPTPSPAPPAGAPAAFSSAGAASPPNRGKPLDLETLIAGKWLYRVGLLLVFIAASYFVKLVIDNKWIGPAGQIAIGILFGAGLLVFSHWLLRRGYQYFSEGITGLGVGVLYLSFWAGSGYYRLFSLNMAFFAMMAVTAAALAIAVGRDSQRIALLALIGGFLTPVLVSTGQNAQVALFTYLIILDAGLLVLARVRQWRWLETPAFAFTQIYFWGWYDRFYDATQLASTMGFALMFFVLFTVLPAIRSRQTAALFPEQITLLFSNAFLYLIALRQMLWPDDKWMLTAAVLVLAALHLYIARFVPRPDAGQERPLVYFLYAGLALTFVTLAIPIRLEGRWITMAWAVEGAALVWAGFRAGMWRLRAAGFLLFTIVLFRLVAFPLSAERFLFNARFATFAIAIASFVAAIYFWRRNADETRAEERPPFAAIAVAVNVLAVWALTLEFHLLFRPEMPGATAGDYLTRMLAVTTFWCIYATALLGAGLMKRIAALRYQAFALFGLMLAKLFFADSTQMGGVYYSLFAFNPRFAAFALVVACFALVLGLARRESDALAGTEQTLMRAMGVIINVVALWGLSLEVYQFFMPPSGQQWSRDTGLAQQLGLSLLWTVYATALVITGIRRQRQGLRYQGLVLFGITIVKVFIFDLGYLSGIYRVASSLALGIVLLVIAFIYQKVLAAKQLAEEK